MADVGPEMTEKVVRKYAAIRNEFFDLITAMKYTTDGNNPYIKSRWTYGGVQTCLDPEIQRICVLDERNEIIFENSNRTVKLCLAATSKSEKRRVEIHDEIGKNFKVVEIYEGKQRLKLAPISSDKFGDLYTDGDSFGSLDWSPCEDYLVFIAEKKSEKSKPFFPPPNTDKDHDVDKKMGLEFLYKDSWGECMPDRVQSCIVKYNTNNGETTIIPGIPDNICPGNVLWAPDGNGFVGVGIISPAIKLGLVYCTNRAGEIFHITEDGTYRVLSKSGMAVMSPRFSPDGKYLVWLEREAGGVHHGALRIVRYDWPHGKDVTVIVDIIRSCTRTRNGQPFYGIYNPTLATRCWTSDSKKVVFSSYQRFQCRVYVIDVVTCKLDEILLDLPREGSLFVADVAKDDTVLMEFSSLNSPPHLTSIKLLKSFAGEAFTEAPIYFSPKQSNELHTVKYMELKGGSSAIYYGPAQGERNLIPMIVVVHGGPHSIMSNSYSTSIDFFVQMGFAVLTVNYHGSTGYGQDFVESLLGNIGTLDVQDVVTGVQEITFPWIDRSNVVLFGGSHGGFLVTHLSGQYPEIFTAVVARNPVTHFPSLSVTSDIPDWAVEECGFKYEGLKSVLKDEVMEKFWQVSPIRYVHKVCAPTLMLLGKNDLRVPPGQAINYYKQLLERNVPTKLMMYNDKHALGTFDASTNGIINSILWFIKYHNGGPDYFENILNKQ